MKTLEIEVRPLTALLLGGQSPPQSGGHKATARTADGRPYLPATALRGALRLELERLLRGRGDTLACSAHRLDIQTLPCTCPICRLFGQAESGTGSLRLEDAHLEGELLGDTAPLVPSVAVGRRSGVVVGRHLAFFEPTGTPGADAVFRASAILVAQGASDETLEEDLENLRAACRALSGIGGSRSRGLGWIEAEIRETIPKSLKDDSAAEIPEGTTALTLRFTAMAPLHFGRNRPVGYFHRTQTYAPGSTVRGALAFALLERGYARPEDPIFQSLFGEESPVSFGSARRIGDLPSATRRKCRPGGHVYDDLPVEVLRREAASLGLSLTLGAHSPCPQSGCFSPKFLPWPLAPSTESLDFRVSTRAALNRKTGTAMDQKLYSLELIEPVTGGRERGVKNGRPLVLESRLVGLDPDAARLLARLHGQEVWLGGKRAKGLGRCRVEARPTPTEDRDATRGAVAELATALAEGWSTITTALPGAPPFFAAGETAVAIVLTEPWSPDDGDGENGPLGQELGRPRAAFLGRTEEGRFGANEADRYQAPSAVLRGEDPPRQAVAPGSIFLYVISRSTLEERLPAWIEKGQRGSGHNRGIGWGRFVIRGLEAGPTLIEKDIIMENPNNDAHGKSVTELVAAEKKWLVERGNEIGELAAGNTDWASQVRGMAEACRHETEPLVLLNLLGYQRSRNSSWKKPPEVYAKTKEAFEDCVRKAEKFGRREAAVELIQLLLLYTIRSHKFHVEERKSRNDRPRRP